MDCVRQETLKRASQVPLTEADDLSTTRPIDDLATHLTVSCRLICRSVLQLFRKDKADDFLCRGILSSAWKSFVTGLLLCRILRRLKLLARAPR